MQRLGKNIKRYAGETVDIERILADMAAAANRLGWNTEVFFQSDGLELTALTRKGRNGQGNRLVGLQPSSEVAGESAEAGTATRDSQKVPRRIYLSSGIHGDEPAGPLAALSLLEEDAWPKNLDLWFCPCLNPVGFRLNCRENAKGLDLNRGYLNPTAEEVLAHVAWLERQPKFDLCLLLHEDWESQGFYLYEQNPDGQASLADAIIEQVQKVCPVDFSESIEGRPARNGIIRPNIDPKSRPDWPEAFYVITHKARLSYTLEAPSDYPLPVRVAALKTAVNTALNVMSGVPGQ